MLRKLREQIHSLGADSALVIHDHRFFGSLDIADHEMYQLSGFTGSCGKLWIGLEEICLFTDSRYLVQAEEECKSRASVYSLNTLYAYIQAHSRVLIIDSWHIFKAQEELLIQQCYPCEVRFNKIFPLTSPAAQRVFMLPSLGRSTHTWKKYFEHPILICDSQDISFLCRVATENPFLPTLQGYALGFWNKSCDELHWLIGVSSAIIEKGPLCSNITCLPFDIWRRSVTETFSKIYYIPNQTPLGLLTWFPQAYPITSWFLSEMRCIKTKEELNAIHQAHISEGIAFTRFLHWLTKNFGNKTCKEYTATLQLEAFRRESPNYQGPSFPTISAWGPSGAMIHYIPKPETQKDIQDGAYLIDAGGQYYWGTTDMTRSLWLGHHTPDPLYQEDYTQVLQGHIDVAMGTFPKGTPGSVLDSLARQALWKNHKDYGHATGHGVGLFSNVHEGPIQLSSASKTALEPGIVCSNEPGYYRQGFWGIRLENLFCVEMDQYSWLTLKTLSLAPFQPTLIQPKVLGSARIAWLNAYHQQVFDTLSPYLSSEVTVWLYTQTRPHAV